MLSMKDFHTMAERRTYNCPNCGAPIGRMTNTCTYCGTLISWIPSVNVYFTTKTYERQVLEARATIDLHLIQECPEFDKKIRNDLVQKIAGMIPEVWEVKYDDEPYRHRRLYIARLPVWRRTDEEGDEE